MITEKCNLFFSFLTWRFCFFWESAFFFIDSHAVSTVLVSVMPSVASQWGQNFRGCLATLSRWTLSCTPKAVLHHWTSSRHSQGFWCRVCTFRMHLWFQPVAQVSKRSLGQGGTSNCTAYPVCFNRTNPRLCPNTCCMILVFPWPFSCTDLRRQCRAMLAEKDYRSALWCKISFTVKLSVACIRESNNNSSASVFGAAVIGLVYMAYPDYCCINLHSCQG